MADPTFRIAPGQRYSEAEPIDSVAPHPDNPNQGDVGQIVESIDEHGFYGAIVVQESTRRIIAGEHRWRSAVARNAPALPVIFVDVDDDEAMRILLIDNEAARKGQNDPAKLADLLVEMEAGDRGLAGTGFDTDDLGTLLEDLASSGAPVSERKKKEVAFDAWDGKKPEQPATEWGDVWTIGPHRVMCGESFDEEMVVRLLDGRPVDLVICDPPYAIYGSSTGIASDIADDAMVRPFFKAMWRAIHAAVEDFAHAYVCCDWRSYAAVTDSAKGTGMASKNCLVWDKGGSGLGSNYANTHEFIAFFSRMPDQQAMGDRRTGQRPVHHPNIFRFNRPHGEDRQHNAAKPVEMLRQFVVNSSKPGDRVLDLFAGSGSTLLAAHAEGRVGLAMEKEPAMCDVIVARLVKATGVEAVKESLAEV